MLEALKFTKGAIARKDFAPVLTHFRIEGGRITGYNGSMALSSPIPLELTCSPKATDFIKALDTCRGTISIHEMPNGSIVVQSGTFKASVKCSTDPFPALTLTGDRVELREGILAPLKLLAPFISEDASRQWSRGILFRGKSAFATDNLVIVETWLGYDFPLDLNIPKTAVTELLRIGLEPDYLVVSHTSCIFHFPGDRWLLTHTYSTEWPDVTRILDRECSPLDIPEGLFQGVRDVSPFSDDLGRIFLGSGKVSTVSLNHEDLGTVSEVPGLIVEDGCYHKDALASLEPVAKKIDLALYPKPCLFYGEALRGAILGIRYAT